MKKQLFLSPSVIEEARSAAIGHGFRELTRIFRSGGRDYIEISAAEAEMLWSFTTFLKLQAQLHYPG